MEKLQLSARAYDRILKVARTAADLDSKDDIGIEDISEAIHYRSWIEIADLGSVLDLNRWY
jgi:magnesium chelatase family protein